MAQTRDVIEEIGRVGGIGERAAPNWAPLQSDSLASIPAPNDQSSERVSPSKPIDVVESIRPTEKTQIEATKKEESSQGFWSRMWDKVSGFVSSIFGGSSTSSSTNASATGSSNKPGGDAIAPVGGTPSLAPPDHYDMNKLSQLLKETRTSLLQTKETQNEVDGALHQSEAALERKMIEYRLAQRQIYIDAALGEKKRYIFRQDDLKKIHADLGDDKTAMAEAKSKARKWGIVNTASQVVVGVAAVALVIFSAIATAGYTLAALPAAMQTAFAIAKPIGTALGGIASVTEGFMTKEARAKEGQLTVGRHREKITQMRIKDSMKEMRHNFDQSLKMVTDMSKLEETRNLTLKAVISPAQAA